MAYTEKRLAELKGWMENVLEHDVEREYIKSFLSTSIAQAVAEERAKVRGEIEGMKNKKHVCESREGRECEYETAIDDLLSSLDKTPPNKV